MVSQKKALYRKVGINEKVNPDFSLTHIKGTTFNVFRESDGMDLGNYHRDNIQSYGFSRSQLDRVKKEGTTNFKRIGK